ncbi:MAG: hypothetical protein CVT72_10910 [Alphaproteobacteria bacterium HGW-Alphaproteobacteria-11]|nr:MAG: hypothetical protein CVT72_10910 [Alphaproteobacteria bacterium HGW-Alphaproteobacteria-11]
MARKNNGSAGNFVSEWFGHRVYPQVISTPISVADQQADRCPFLTRATGEERKCIKAEAAKGVCTINSLSNGSRQDWLVCPYRALNDDLVSNSIRQLFRLPAISHPFVIPAVTLKRTEVRSDIAARLAKGQHVFIYFDKKTSGELSIPSTERSPEFSFDVTVIELTDRDGVPHIGKFGIIEIQTMDFHGSYRDAVRNLREGLRMHPARFGDTVQDNQWWLADGVEGPNIANVFKRTFYQMMFKFQLGQHEQCAGCVLAIPQSVWDSWQRHLGAPELKAEVDGTYSLLAPGRMRADFCPAWIYVFEPNISAGVTPSPIVMKRMIGTDAPSISHWALEVAPAAALSNIDAEAGFLSALSRRLKLFWPDLARTVVADVSVEGASKASRQRSRTLRRKEVRVKSLEERSEYSGPSSEAVGGEEPDEG